ncbi:PTS glucose transporter subunit IIA [Companilactobacillus huachuanensis]|uniref:PTS glucose transporter subunit IIA n=1 Tax=Companilactobacillus huachuanensis TaxID=2559914 RepID=A0ABW1RPU5_9LACO
MLFQRKKTLKSVANGKIIPLSDVNDEVFSTNMMGVGYAVTDHDGKIYSPVDGKIESIFPTLHAITIKSNKNVTILVHMGLDTVDLKGAPFELFVKAGDTVNENQLMAQMNLPMLTEKNKDSAVMVVLPEVQKGSVNANDSGSIEDIAFKF